MASAPSASSLVESVIRVKWPASAKKMQGHTFRRGEKRIEAEQSSEKPFCTLRNVERP